MSVWIRLITSVAAGVNRAMRSLMVEEEGADSRAGEQVVHVVVGPRKVGHLGLELAVDGAQLLVDGLQLFLGGLQLLVGGLELLVDRLHLLVGGLELLVGGLHLLEGGLKVFLLGPELALEGDDPLVVVRGRSERRSRRFFPAESEHAGATSSKMTRNRSGAASAPAPSPTGRTVRLTVTKSPLVLMCSPGQWIGSLWVTAWWRAVVRTRRSPSRAMGRMLTVRVAGGGFQELAGAAVNVEDLAAGVDEHAGLGVVQEERLLGQLAVRGLGSPRAPWRCDCSGFPLAESEGTKSRSSGLASRREIFFAHVEIRLAIHHLEERRELTHGLRASQKQEPPGFKRVVEERDQSLLQVPVHVDQQVAATDQVEPGERRVLDHVLLGEDHAGRG